MKKIFESVKKIFKKLTLIEYFTYSLIIIIAVVLDQVTKLVATEALHNSGIGTKVIIKGVLSFTYETNDGIAFGMLDNARWLFMTVSVLAIAILGVYLFGGIAENRLYSIAAALIIGGGIGNMIDRIFFGEVVDFIEVTFVEFAIFNVADCFVCIGAGLLLLALIIDLVKEARKKQD